MRVEHTRVDGGGRGVELERGQVQRGHLGRVRCRVRVRVRVGVGVRVKVKG